MMILVLSVLLIAFVYGIWMGLSFYRETTVQVRVEAETITNLPDRRG
jgi:hypothetical protein